MRNLFLFLVNGLAAVFLLWVLLSWCDVIADNTSENPQHSEYNAFAVLVDFAEGVSE